MTKLAYNIENGYRKAGDKLLNAAERKEKIIEILKEKKAVKILSLSKMLKVTRETIRKDLYELEKEGLIKKFMAELFWICLIKNQIMKEGKQKI